MSESEKTPQSETDIFLNTHKVQKLLKKEFKSQLKSLSKNQLIDIITQLAMANTIEKSSNRSKNEE